MFSNKPFFQTSVASSIGHQRLQVWSHWHQIFMFYWKNMWTLRREYTSPTLHFCIKWNKIGTCAAVLIFYFKNIVTYASLLLFHYFYCYAINARLVKYLANNICTCGFECVVRFWCVFYYVSTKIYHYTLTN